MIELGMGVGRYDRGMRYGCREIWQRSEVWV
jgi:hypothetical protein